MRHGKYLVLGLAPKKILEKDRYLNIFWKNMETLYKNFLPAIIYGKMDDSMNEIERIFTGLKKYQGLDEDYMVTTAEDLLVFTRLFHSSTGPCKGNLFEELIEEWLKDGGFTVVRDLMLKTALQQFLTTWQNRWEKILGKGKIDFVLKKDDRLALVELRMSEHTGGRTGQESLMDKFNKFLETLTLEKDFADAIRKSRIENVEMIIEIVFSEDSKSIIDQPNTGRLNSLISYLCEENHIYGKLRKLIKISRDEFGEELRRKREFSFDHEGIHFSLKLMYGNEFFKAYLGKDLDELLGNLIIPDDVWMLFTIAINELRRLKLSRSGKTLTCEVYEIVEDLSREGDNVFERYEEEIQNVQDLDSFVEKLDEVTNKIREHVLKVAEEARRQLFVLDTDDVSKSYRYLKCIAYCVLIVHKFIRSEKVDKHRKKRMKNEERRCE